MELPLCEGETVRTNAIRSVNSLFDRDQQLLHMEEMIKQKELSKLSAGTCAFCNKSLYGVKALDVFDRRCCSSPCVLSLRRKLAADAALKRFS